MIEWDSQATRVVARARLASACACVTWIRAAARSPRPATSAPSAKPGGITLFLLRKKKILVAELQMKPFFMALMMKCTDN